MASRPDTQNGTSAGSGLATGTALDAPGPSTGKALPAASTTDAFIGRVFSHYRLEQRLGAGGMGLLYRGTDLTLGRAVRSSSLHGIWSATRLPRRASFKRPAPRARSTTPTSPRSTTSAKWTASCSS